MPSKDPNPGLWTLRFKNHKLTVLLFVEKTQSFTSIKSELLEVLKARGHEEVNGQPLPIDSDDVIFGIPVEKNDPLVSKGWVGLDIPEVEVEDMGTTKKVGGKKSVLNASPYGAGLKDGAMLAFKFRKEDSKMAEDGLDVDDTDWDVIMPSYEDENASQS